MGRIALALEVWGVSRLPWRYFIQLLDAVSGIVFVNIR
jgi:hypothetical protein